MSSLVGLNEQIAFATSLIAAIVTYAGQAGLALPATTLVIFGNPKAGTPLMQCARTAAIDLPSKALVWAENGKTWIAVNDMDYLAKRHHMTDCPAVPKVADKLRQLVGQTVAQ